MSIYTAMVANLPQFITSYLPSIISSALKFFDTEGNFKKTENNQSIIKMMKAIKENIDLKTVCNTVAQTLAISQHSKSVWLTTARLLKEKVSASTRSDVVASHKDIFSIFISMGDCRWNRRMEWDTDVRSLVYQSIKSDQK